MWDECEERYPNPTDANETREFSINPSSLFPRIDPNLDKPDKGNFKFGRFRAFSLGGRKRTKWCATDFPRCGSHTLTYLLFTKQTFVTRNASNVIRTNNLIGPLS